MLYTKYLKFFFTITIGITALLVGFNVFMDPFTVFNSPRIAGVNANKSEFGKKLRMAKALAVERRKPDAVILGSSRAEYGLDPDFPGWESKKVYNLALSAANIYEELRYLQHAEAIQSLSTVVLAIDFFSFNANFENAFDFDENNLAVLPDGTPNDTPLLNYMSSIFSIDALFSSWRTLVNQDRLSRSYFDNGMRALDTIEEEIRLAGGQGAFFTRVEQAFVRGIWFPANRRDYSFENFSSDNSTFDYFRRTLEVTRQSKTELIIIISPVHARLLTTIDAVGLWPKFEDWKRHVVRIVSEDLTQHPSRTSVAVWDFSGYNSLTTENVPDADDREGRMQWFWGPSHYKKELGDIMLGRVFDYQSTSGSGLDAFGTILSSSNIETHLARIRQEKLKWYAANPRLVSSIGSEVLPILQSLNIDQ